MLWNARSWTMFLCPEISLRTDASYSWDHVALFAPGPSLCSLAGSMWNLIMAALFANITFTSAHPSWYCCSLVVPSTAGRREWVKRRCAIARFACKMLSLNSPNVSNISTTLSLKRALLWNRSSWSSLRVAWGRRLTRMAFTLSATSSRSLLCTLPGRSVFDK